MNNFIIRFLFLLCSLFGFAFGLMGDIEYDGRLNIELHHSFEKSAEPQYSHRGEIAIKSLHTGSLFVESVLLTPQQIQQLKDLVRNKGFYRVKAIAKTPDGKESTFLTFMAACALAESHLSDIISVSLDHMGNVVGVSVSSPITCQGVETSNEHLRAFNTSVYIRHMEVGPVPDTASYIQKLEREREAKERGETKDNRSFFGKYWIYIVPILIVLLFSSAANPDVAGAQR